MVVVIPVGIGNQVIADNGFQVDLGIGRQVQFNDGWWGNADVSFPEIGGAYLTTDNAGGKDVTKIELTITAALLDHLKACPGDYFGLNTEYQGDGRVGMVIQGSDWIITKIAIQ